MSQTELQKKKMAAAMAAVTAYIKGYEEAAARQAVGKPPLRESAPMGMWGFSGRQAMMNNRQMMQWRSFK